MSIPFGPQLIGQTEKTLNAVLRRLLEETDLSERQWVAMKIAGQLHASGEEHDLRSAVAERAHLVNAAELVAELIGRGLLVGGRPTPSGDKVTASIQVKIDELTAPVWRDLDENDVAAATRVLTQVLDRALELLGNLTHDPIARRRNGHPRSESSGSRGKTPRRYREQRRAA